MGRTRSSGSTTACSSTPAIARARTTPRFWDRLRAGEYVSAEFKRRAKGGREVWLQASYNPILDLNGRPFKVVKFASDVTAAKLAASDVAGQITAIRRSQAVITFAMDGTILEANEHFLSTVGYAADEIIGQHHRMFVAPAERSGPAYAQFWDRLRAGEYVSAEFRRVAKDGREVWIQASYNPIFDLNDHPIKVVKFATDITEQVSQRARMEQLSLVANGTDNSVIITDAQRRIEYVNPGFERLTGYSMAEVVGKYPGKILQGVHTDTDTIKAIRTRLDRGEPFCQEILNYSKSGEPYWISLAINPVRGQSGKVERFVSIQANVNETKQKSLDYTIKLDTIGESNALAEWSPAGQLETANAAIRRWHGVFAGDPIHLDRILTPDERQRVIAGTSLRREIRWPKTGGGSFSLDAVFSSLRDLQGKIVRIMMCGTDVSDRRLAIEETSSAMRDLRQSGRPDRQHRRQHRPHRLPDQHPVVERRRGSVARGGRGPRLRGRGGGGPHAGQPVGGGGEEHQRARAREQCPHEQPRSLAGQARQARRARWLGPPDIDGPNPGRLIVRCRDAPSQAQSSNSLVVA